MIASESINIFHKEECVSEAITESTKSPQEKFLVGFRQQKFHVGDCPTRSEKLYLNDSLFYFLSFFISGLILLKRLPVSSALQRLFSFFETTWVYLDGRQSNVSMTNSTAAM